MTDLIPDLHVNPQVLVMIPGKKDRLVFDSSFMVDEKSCPYNADCDSELEPDIFFGSAWVCHLTYIYNLCISFPNEEIFITDNDITLAFGQIKYNPNIISAKAFIVGPWLFVCTGQNFGDQPSPANFKPIAKAQTALARKLSIEDQIVPDFHLYMDKVIFALPPPPDTQFTPARPNKFNKGVLATDGSLLPLQFNMYVDDDMSATVGEESTWWNMHCSLHSAYLILGEPDLDRRPNAINLDKFVWEPISHKCTHLGFCINSQTLIVTIPDEKQAAILEVLMHTWGPHHQSFTIKQAPELLGTLLSLCRACKWGIFLFTNLLKAVHEMLDKNLK